MRRHKAKQQPLDLPEVPKHLMPRVVRRPLGSTMVLTFRTWEPLARSHSLEISLAGASQEGPMVSLYNTISNTRLGDRASSLCLRLLRPHRRCCNLPCSYSLHLFIMASWAQEGFGSLGRLILGGLAWYRYRIKHSLLSP